MDAEPALVVDGIAFGESVRWHDGRLWFCDWIDGDVISVASDGADRTVHAHLDAFPLCVDWDRDHRLLIVDGAGRQLVVMIEGERRVLADLAEVSDKPWNEIAAHPSGRIFVNGIGFDMMAGEEPASGQIAVVETDGSIRRVADGLAFPNGMVVSGDGSTLLVAESQAGRITSFSIGEHGDLGPPVVFADVPGSAPDGLCLAPNGSVWYADVPNRRCQRVADGGEVMETITFDRGCFSCALSPDGALFVAATVWDADTFATRRGVVYRVRPAESS